MTAHDILNNPFLNKGTAFTLEERKELGLIGLLPPYVQTIEEQAAQTYAQMQTKANDLEKRLFLMEILIPTGLFSITSFLNIWKNSIQLYMIQPLQIPLKAIVISL